MTSWRAGSGYLTAPGGEILFWEHVPARARDIVDMTIRGDVPAKMIEAIPVLSHLIDIDISNCGLTKIPDEFALIRGLRCLYAQDNQITEIPAWFGKIRHVGVLVRLDRNRISIIPAWLGAVCSRQVRMRVSLDGNPIHTADVRCAMNKWCVIDKTTRHAAADHYAAYKATVFDVTDRSEMYPETRAALEYLENLHI